MNMIDLFCGCGGLSAGLEQAGFTVSFANDIDHICCETYLKNIGISADRMFIGDIAELN